MEDLKNILLWGVSLLGLALIILHGFTWSARFVDLRWCTESLATVNANNGAINCDPPSRIIWVEKGSHWVCKCP